MKETIEIKSGDLYPNGTLRKRILDHRIKLETTQENRNAWRQAPAVPVTIWSTELHGDVTIGDTIQIGNSDAFVITSIKFKHATENSYDLEFHGPNDKVVFKPWGSENIKITRNK